MATVLLEVGAGRHAVGTAAPPPTPVPAGRDKSYRSRLRNRRSRERLVVLSFMAPVFVGLGLFLVYPLVSAIYFSFTKFDLINPPEWVGLRNWDYLFEDPVVRQAAGNTVWFVVVMVPARMVGALLTAMLLNRVKRARSVYRTLFYLPALAPPVAATLTFVFLLKPGTGPVNSLLHAIGIEGPLWFNSPEWAKPSLALLGLWNVGDLMIIFIAALLNVPVERYEAASMDGANPWQKFRFVTLPGISPVLVFAAVTGMISTLQYFTQSAVAANVASGMFTSGGGVSGTYGFPEGSTFTYPLWLYVTGFRYHALGYANVLAVVLFVVAITATTILLRRFRAFTGSPQ